MDLLAVKRRFDLAELQCLSGATISNVAIGYETYGELNAARDNAILIAHFFSGSSHAAGKYAPDDPQPGYWDAIVGPGKAVDTNRYFVISSDTLVNLNVHDKNVITTGPASLDPATQKPYGLKFPAVAIADFVRVQKALIDSLGIKRLHAVMGPSMGGLQTFEWAASFPECVGRIIPVIAAPNFRGWLTAGYRYGRSRSNSIPPGRAAIIMAARRRAPDSKPRCASSPCTPCTAIGPTRRRPGARRGRRRLATSAATPLRHRTDSRRRRHAAAGQCRRQFPALSGARQPDLYPRRRRRGDRRNGGAGADQGTRTGDLRAAGSDFRRRMDRGNGGDPA